MAKGTSITVQGKAILGAHFIHTLRMVCFRTAARIAAWQFYQRRHNHVPLCTRYPWIFGEGSQVSW
jgi:hypothetical protein